MGSGTIAISAGKHHRKSIGIRVVCVHLFFAKKNNLGSNERNSAVNWRQELEAQILIGVGPITLLSVLKLFVFSSTFSGRPSG